MFQYDDDRKPSRAAHDSPISPRPIWERRGIRESDYERIRQEKADRKDAAIRESANDALDRAIRRIGEYQIAARANIADIPLVRHYAYRYKQLKELVAKLTAELLLARDNTINPQKTIVFYTGVIGQLLNTPVEMPKSSVKIQTPEAYQRELKRSRAMSPGVVSPIAKKPGEDYRHFPPVSVSESQLRAINPRATPEQEHAQMAAILADKRAKRLAEIQD